MPTAVFDMNETTLDLGPVRVLVDDLLAPSGGFTVWFQKLLQLSMAVTATGQPFVDFGTLAKHAFWAVDATAPNPKLRDDKDAFAAVGAAMAVLKPHPDVDAALVRLKNAGWTTVALTNSGQAMVDAQCAKAGLTQRFDHILSVQQTQTYKPAQAPYRKAIEVVTATATAKNDEVFWMVAAHDWDLAGAKAVGMNTAFVHRPGMSWADTYSPPDMVAADFTGLVDQLLAGVAPRVDK